MELLENIHWYGQASVKIEANGMKIYIDPFQLKETDIADFILITHSHFDHLSIENIDKVRGEKTVFIAPEDAAQKLADELFIVAHIVEPGQQFKFGNLELETVAAYNIDKQYHPKENNWVGYVININGIKIYHSGDTGLIPEMKAIKCDIALLPMGQTYTMDKVEDAAQAAIYIGAKVAIPIHYSIYEGSLEDAYKFRELLEGRVKVIIKEME